MEIQYRQDIGRRYMLIRKEKQDKTGFREKMLLRNTIPGLIRTDVQYMNGEAWYCYDIRSRQSLKNLFTGSPMSGPELNRLLSGFRDLMKELDRYLLSGTDLLVSPDFIFWNLDQNMPEFCYYPDYREGTEGFMELAQYLIDTVDQTDSAAAKLAYDYFDLVSDGIFSPEGLLKQNRESPVPSAAFFQPGYSVPDGGSGSPLPDLSDISLFSGNTEAEGSYPAFGNEDEVLPVDRLWEEENSRNYYLDPSAPPEKTRNQGGKLARAGIALCLMLAASAGILYGFLFMHPEYLEGIGLSDRNYVLVGALIALAFAGIIAGIVHFLQRKAAEKLEEEEAENSLFDMPEERPAFRPDALEEAQSKVSERPSGQDPAMDYSGKTTLLTKTRDGFEGKRDPVLTGQINGELRSFRIDRTPFLIGKLTGKADGIIPDSRISRIHACIREDEGRFFLSDLNSTNGTRINERLLEINETAELKDGDTVTFADIPMSFRLG